MKPEKELKILEQGIIGWLLLAIASFFVWVIFFSLTFFVFKFSTGSSLWLVSAIAATILTVCSGLVTKKLIIK